MIKYVYAGGGGSRGVAKAAHEGLAKGQFGLLEYPPLLSTER